MIGSITIGSDPTAIEARTRPVPLLFMPRPNIRATRCGPPALTAGR